MNSFLLYTSQATSFFIQKTRDPSQFRFWSLLVPAMSSCANLDSKKNHFPKVPRSFS